ncbi:MAG: hypothetical protein JO074_00925 [Frankiales bacterium]|nr:hypothetical protein [Frankiales bacterium]
MVVFISVGVVGMFTAGLVKSRRELSRARVAAEGRVTADRHDPVRDWLARRNQRVRSVLVFAARFPFIAAPALGAAIGFGISNQRNCVTYRNSDHCAFYIPGHHTVLGGAGWGLLAGVLAYGAALMIRQSLIRAAAAQAAANEHAALAAPQQAPSPWSDDVSGPEQSSAEPEFVLVREGRPRHAR